MATNHRGNPVNDNNKAKTNADRIFEGSNFGPNPPGEPTDAQMMDAEMYFAEKSEYPDDSETAEEEEIAERKSQAYMKEMEEYYRPVSDRTYGKDEMIENDIDDDKY